MMSIKTEKTEKPTPKPEESKALVVEAPKGALSVADQAALALYGDEDYQDAVNVTVSVTPTISLMQMNSPPVAENPDEYRPGMFVHSISKEIMEKPLTLIPFYLTETFAIWNKIDDGGGMVARSVDGKTWDKPDLEFSLKHIPGKTFNTGRNVAASGLTEWGKDGSKPVADKSIVMFAMVKNRTDLGPVRLFFRSTGLAPAGKFISLLSSRRVRMVNGQSKALPPFAFQFELSSNRVTKDTKNWYVPVFDKLQLLDIAGEDAELASFLKQTYELCKDRFRSAALSEDDVKEVMADDGQGPVVDMGDKEY